MKEEIKKYCDLVLSMSMDFKLDKIDYNHYINNLLLISEKLREEINKKKEVKEQCKHPDWAMKKYGSTEICNKCGKQWG